jgi:hypothetical protein
MGFSSRRWLNQSTHCSVANSTAIILITMWRLILLALAILAGCAGAPTTPCPDPDPDPTSACTASHGQTHDSNR